MGLIPEVILYLSLYVSQGETINVEHGTTKKYIRNFTPGEELRPWRVKLVSSSVEAARLPGTMRSGEAELICQIENRLTDRDLENKGMQWYKLGQPYKQAEIILRTNFGSADITFQIFGKDGQCNMQHEDIPIEWYLPNQDVSDSMRESPELMFEAQ
jgi:hypothetical protein